MRGDLRSVRVDADRRYPESPVEVSRGSALAERPVGRIISLDRRVARMFERLHRRGIDNVTLCRDNDDAGRAAAVRAVEQSAPARQSPDLYVIEPERLAPAKDPDDGPRAMTSRMARTARHPSMWNRMESSRACGRSHSRLAHTEPSRLASGGRCPPPLTRLALEQEDVLGASGVSMRPSRKAVEPAFEARFTREPRIERDLAACRSGSAGWVVS